MAEKNEKVFSKTAINWYPGHMAKTKRELKERMNLIDCIYEIIDARMPLSSKIKDIDDILRDKPRILIMTKKDLCDLDTTNKWVKKYEDDSYRVILVDLNSNNDYKKIIEVTKELMRNVQEKRKNQGLKEKEIKVGVVGVPNVGKSTLINKLAGRKVASVGNKPGVTKQVNWLKTNCGLLLLDTPGILWPKIEDNEEALNLASTATIKTEILNMTDIGGYLVSFLKNYYPHILKERYKIEVSKDPNEVFASIAKKIGAMSNGETDYEKVSLRLYNDVVSGKIKGVTFDQWKPNYQNMNKNYTTKVIN